MKHIGNLVENVSVLVSISVFGLARNLPIHSFSFCLDPGIWIFFSITEMGLSSRRK